MRYIHYIFLLLPLISVLVLAAEPDYYKILGVSKKADEKEIRSAYKNLSKKFHPDKNLGDDSAQHKFIEIGEAYEVLMDPEKREVYDRYGKEGLQNGGRGGQGGGNPFGGFDPFKEFFGGGGQRSTGKPRGTDVESSIEYTLRQFFNGENTDFKLELQNICDKCEGTGSKDGEFHKCSKCKGRGRLVQKVQLAPGMYQQFEQACPHCQGKGQQITHKCDRCSGQGVFRGERNFNVHVQPGTPREFVEVFKGQSDQSPQWNAGDLRVRIREKTTGNMGYRRVENNLYRTEVLSLKEALKGGWSRSVPFLDNYDNSVIIKRDDGEMVVNGEVEVVKGKGMPILNGVDEYGDLFIEYVVVNPGGNKKILKALHDEL